MSFALPALWSTKLREQLRHLKMADTESFVAYSTRARTLRTLINFEKEVVSEFDLAEAVTFGLLPELKTKTHDFQLLLTTPFKYAAFEQRVASFDDNLPRRAPAKTRNATSSQPASHTPKPTAEENLWRLRAYLDSKGLCHHCKKACGSLPGA